MALALSHCKYRSRPKKRGQGLRFPQKNQYQHPHQYAYRSTPVLYDQTKQPIKSNRLYPEEIQALIETKKIKNNKKTQVQSCK